MTHACKNIMQTSIEFVSINKQIKDDQASYRKRILKSCKGKPKKFYRYIRKLRTVKDNFVDNGALSSTDQEAAQILGKFFSNVFVNETTMQLVQDINQTDNLEVTIDEQTAKKKLLKLHEDKAQGPDNIHPAVLRNCADILSKPLSMIFNKSLHEGILPDDWKSATVSPIFKKGDKSDPGNYIDQSR